MTNRLLEMTNGRGKSLVLLPTVDLINAIWKHMNRWNLSFDYMYFILCIFLIFGATFSNFRLWKIFLIFCLCYYLLCRRKKNHFDVHFWRIRPVLFPVERWKRWGLWKKKWTERCFLPAIVGIFPLYIIWSKYFSLFVPWIGV